MGAFFSRIWPHLLVVAAVLGGLWYVDHRGYQRARKDFQMDQLKIRAMFDGLLRDSEGRMAGVIRFQDRDLADKIAAVKVYHRTIIQPAIEKEIAHDPALARPDARMSDGLWRQLNAALAGSACSRRADGGIECALPAAATVARPDVGDAGAGDVAERRTE
ncbi:hypothetical protein [Sphingobium sp. MI1205]|uniref:hypothetical protein n=1 Tax=Sphingobium sp. MI1205 TaxID=407020 RepID=UPI00076FE0BF|nr:hypothetical protein [Sphingobium sp. MI1205]AMK18684.1 hypothetical protein K663_11525 [Sphingobium sp. MI1205]